MPGEEIDWQYKAGHDKTMWSAMHLLILLLKSRPACSKTHNFMFFMGPKKAWSLLNSLGARKWERPLISVFFWYPRPNPVCGSWNKIHSVIPNYGIAIIILTVFYENFCFGRLANKSYKSMSEIKKNFSRWWTEIREKHKKWTKQKKWNQGINGPLYKTYKVNPVGGVPCPMVSANPGIFLRFTECFIKRSN